MIIILGFLLINVIPLLVAIAFFTLLERKIIAAVQRRRGPNLNGLWGLLQPVSDGLKLVFQEQFFPKTSKKILFLFSPVFVFFFSLSYWIFIPTPFGAICNTNLSLLVVYTISSVSVFGVISAGFVSNSKYAILGGIRAAAQFISYEICIGVCYLFIALVSGSLDFIEIVFVQKFCGSFGMFGWPFMFGFFICLLAETNRTPFDLAEAEAEIVAGFHTEYSSTGFALFFLGEYCTILMFSSIFVLLFLGGWSAFFFKQVVVKCIFKKVVLTCFFFFKVIVVCAFIVLIRAFEPRLRFDQVMFLCWKNLMPCLFGCFFIICEFLFLTNSWKFFLAFLVLLLQHFFLFKESDEFLD